MVSPIIDEVFMNLRTIALISILAVGLLAVPLRAEAQQAGKVYRLGILRFGSTSSRYYAPQYQILLPILRELGYVEGKNLLIEYRYAKNKPDRLLGLASSLFAWHS